MLDIQSFIFSQTKSIWKRSPKIPLLQCICRWHQWHIIYQCNFPTSPRWKTEKTALRLVPLSQVLLRKASTQLKLCVYYIYIISYLCIHRKRQKKGVGVLICSIFQGIQKQLPFFTAKMNQRHPNRSSPCQTQTWTQNQSKSSQKDAEKTSYRHHKMQLEDRLELVHRYLMTKFCDHQAMQHEAGTMISRFGIRVQAPPAVRCLMTPRSWDVGCDLKWNPQMVPQFLKG